MGEAQAACGTYPVCSGAGDQQEAPLFAEVESSKDVPARRAGEMLPQARACFLGD